MTRIISGAVIWTLCICSAAATSAGESGESMVRLMQAMCLPAYPSFAGTPKLAKDANLFEIETDESYLDPSTQLVVTVQEPFELIEGVSTPALCMVSTLPGADYSEIAPQAEAFARSLNTQGELFVDEGSFEEGEISWEVTLQNGDTAEITAFDSTLGTVGLIIGKTPDLNLGNNPQ